MYDESDLFTPENIEILPEFTILLHHPVWNNLKFNYNFIRTVLDRLPKAITYNDFYWTNLAVSIDGREALMFDYNLMGKGYAWSDVRNVTASLNPGAAAAFLAEYGPTDPLERALDDVISPIITLILAARRTEFSSWAQPQPKRPGRPAKPHPNAPGTVKTAPFKRTHVSQRSSAHYDSLSTAGKAYRNRSK